MHTLVVSAGETVSCILRELKIISQIPQQPVQCEPVPCQAWVKR